MSLKKFYGANTREAMIEARRALGDDAVVISTRKTDRGVEVVAASQSALASLTDRDSMPERPIVSHGSSRDAQRDTQHEQQREMQREPAEPMSLAAPAPRRSFNERVDSQRQDKKARPRTEAPRDEPVPFLQFIQDQPSAADTPQVVRNPRAGAKPVPPPAAVRKPNAPTFEQATTPVADPPVLLGATGGPVVDELMHEVRAEFSQIREWMMGQFDTIAFQEAGRRHPVAASIQKDLLTAGFSPRLARDLAQRMPEQLDAHQARGWAAAVLEKNLSCIRPDQDLIDAGGIYALVGPTGVGKTTTVAKLASRCAVKYGRESVGLVTIDSYRIGAQDQLRIYGKILGISVHTAQDRETLLGVLRSLAGKRLILIDTVGLGQRDERVQELLAALGSNPIKRLLVMNASAQAETLEDVVHGYRGPQGAGLAGAVLSKTDEAVRLGSPLDVLIRNRVPLFYETNGQRVPEDIQVANAKSLVLRAVTHLPARAFQVPDDEVGLTFFNRNAAGNAGTAHA